LGIPGKGRDCSMHAIISPSRTYKKSVRPVHYEVPVGKCIDYLATRGDVDMSRIAVCGSSLGGYYAARAGSHEHRLAACISYGAIWDIGERWKTRNDDHPLAGQITWVFGA
jgi:dienelactone hydrolase